MTATLDPRAIGDILAPAEADEEMHALLDDDEAEWFACDHPDWPFLLGVTRWCQQPCGDCLASAFEVLAWEPAGTLDDPESLAEWTKVIETLGGRL